MGKRTFYLAMLATFVLMLTACNSGGPEVVVTVAPFEPPSKIEIVENEDDVKNAYTTRNKLGKYDNVSLEEGMAVAQIMCSRQHKITITVGNANPLNTYELTLDECPELLSGVPAQIVNTETTFSFECQNCTVGFVGELEYGEAYSVWRGNILVEPSNNGLPVLFLIPISEHWE